MAWQILFGALAILLILGERDRRKRPAPARRASGSLIALADAVRAGTLGGPEDGAEVTHA